jgi:hypothetical protein
MADYRLHLITWKNVIDYNWLRWQLRLPHVWIATLNFSKWGGYRYNKTKRQIFNGWQKITNTVTQKTEDWATQTPLKLRIDMNSDVPYESAVRTSLIPLSKPFYIICLINFLKKIHLHKSYIKYLRRYMLQLRQNDEK